MNIKIIAGFLFAFIMINVLALAQDEDMQLAVDKRVSKMAKFLELTDAQAQAIKPILKDYFVKREAVLEESSGGGGIMDHVSVDGTLKAMKQSEYQQLAKVLNEDQMKKWVNKETLMATLNPDSPQSADDDATTLTAEGANFKF